MLKGSIVALITPFKDENLSKDEYVKLINYHLENGTNGVVPGGTTGESPTLSHNEHRKIITIKNVWLPYCINICVDTEKHLQCREDSLC